MLTHTARTEESASESIQRKIDLDKRQAYDLTKAVMTMNAMTADAKEGICAFLDKRPPQWTGR